MTPPMMEPPPCAWCGGAGVALIGPPRGGHQVLCGPCDGTGVHPASSADVGPTGAAIDLLDAQAAAGGPNPSDPPED